MSYNADSVKLQIDQRLRSALQWCERRKMERAKGGGFKVTPTPIHFPLTLTLLLFSLSLILSPILFASDASVGNTDDGDFPFKVTTWKQWDAVCEDYPAVAGKPMNQANRNELLLPDLFRVHSGEPATASILNRSCENYWRYQELLAKTEAE